MAGIDRRKFMKIVRRYHCVKDVFETVCDHIFENCSIEQEIKFDKCLVILTDNSKRWFRKPGPNLYFDLVFSYRETPGNTANSTEPGIMILYDAAFQLTEDEYDEKFFYPDLEYLMRDAKKLINPPFNKLV